MNKYTNFQFIKSLQVGPQIPGMSVKLKLLLLLVLSLTPISIQSQAIDYHGSPYLQNYNPSVNNSYSQLWDIDQDQRGIMYFGGTEGLFEFDGTNWRHYPMPKHSIVRSLAVDSLGTVFIGGNNDFGFFKPNQIGTLKYHSLTHLVPNDAPYFQSIWRIYTSEQGVYFFSRKRIFRYINNTIEVIPVNLQLPCAYLINGDIFIKDRTNGLARIDGNQIVLLKNCEELSTIEQGYFFINSFSDTELLISFSKTNHFYKYNLNTQTLTNHHIPEATRKYLAENYQFSTADLENGTIAIGTSRGGVIIINKQGEIVELINSNRGLSTDLVSSVFLDSEKNLWSTSRKGISRIDISYPANFYYKKQGLEANVVCSKFHNGTQYIGTDIKFYYLPPYQLKLSNDNHVVKSIAKPFAPNQIIDVNGHLLLCNWYGVEEIVNDKSKTFYQGLTRVFCAAHDKQYPNKIALGQNNAVVICTFKETGVNKDLVLTDTLSIEDNNISQIRSMAFDNDGNLWLASLNEGIFLIRFMSKDLKSYHISHFSEKNGLPNILLESLVTKFNHKINISTPKGIYKAVLPPAGSPDSLTRFTHDKYWGKTFTEDSCAVRMIEQIDSISYFISGDKTGILTVQDSNAQFNFKPFLKLGQISSVSVENNRYINLGQFESFCTFDSQNKKDYARPFNVLIRKVIISTNDSILFDGAFLNPTGKKVINNQTEEFIPTLENRFNSLRINFSANFLESSEKNQYSYMIEGFDKDWSPWSPTASAVYTNIPHGKLKFKVKAKNVYGTVSEISTYSFLVKPAWYQTKWAYILYCLLSIFLIALIAKLYNRNLTLKNTKLETMVKKRTHELEETIDKLKDTQSTLVQQEKMASLGILTAGVAHEINNPLNYILGGYTGLDFYFREHEIEDEEVQLLMDSIKIGVDRAADIVAGLNQFSRTKNTFDEKCDLHSIIDNSILMIKHLLKTRIKLVKNYDAESSTVLGNVGKLHQVFINILTNSCQAIKGKGIITITTNILEQSLIIKIFDTGEGINNDNLDKITDPFFTTKDPGEGSGLGLSITYKIIQEHNGKLEFTSELGRSTTALITLPLI
ncbi:ATP-binding protein [Saccharicrinis sp. 156]|uniref:ATP-binding protein n=1 Tax=Saccharicrinis sp. 156 TaxID=3417574 RepID=UPI003D32F651